MPLKKRRRRLTTTTRSQVNLYFKRAGTQWLVSAAAAIASVVQHIAFEHSYRCDHQVVFSWQLQFSSFLGHNMPYEIWASRPFWWGKCVRVNWGYKNMVRLCKHIQKKLEGRGLLFKTSHFVIEDLAYFFFQKHVFVIQGMPCHLHSLVLNRRCVLLEDMMYFFFKNQGVILDLLNS